MGQAACLTTNEHWSGCTTWCCMIGFFSYSLTMWYPTRHIGRATFRRFGLQRPRDPLSSESSCVRAWPRHRHRRRTHALACAGARRRPPSTGKQQCTLSIGRLCRLVDRPIPARRYCSDQAGASSAPRGRGACRVDAGHEQATRRRATAGRTAGRRAPAGTVCRTPAARRARAAMARPATARLKRWDGARVRHRPAHR